MCHGGAAWLGGTKDVESTDLEQAGAPDWCSRRLTKVKGALRCQAAMFSESGRPDSKWHSVDAMHDRAQLKPALSQSTLQRLH